MTKIIMLVCNILKDGEKNFDPEIIISSPTLCSLLLAFDKEDGLEKFFKNNIRNVNAIKEDLDLSKDYYHNLSGDEIKLLANKFKEIIASKLGNTLTLKND